MPLIEETASSPTSLPVDVSSSESSSEVKKYQPTSTDFRHYYEHYLPFKSIFTWLNHSHVPQNDFTMREFAFEFKSGAYQRYNSFENANEFKATVLKSQPTRFEIGAVYPVPPKIRKTVSKNVMKPIMKEFVLDIDLTDYDDIRTCCSKTSICSKCWKFINIAIKIIDVALRDDFGFEHLVWVFSGRRGVHCWISDYRARVLDEQKRRAIVEYLDVLNVKSSNKKSGLNLRKPYHPHVERSFDIIRDQFIDIIVREQNTWKDDQRAIDDLARSLPDFRLSKLLIQFWTKNPNRSSADKWVDVDRIYHENANSFNFDIQNWKRETIFKTMYPRSDVEVSRQMIHLLKSPFCIHPGTGNVCVPFNPNEKEFDPFTAPNLKQLFDEEAEFTENNDADTSIMSVDQDNDSQSTKKKEIWENSSLKPYIDYFNKYVEDLLKDEIREKRNRKQMEGGSKENLEF
ncbi:hypothetical protein B5S28_g968 [[Candida] boidinii]|nr:hypothetical protein B5S28_g968 [[Candida] boidinii]